MTQSRKRPFRDRLHARWRRSILNPYYLENRRLKERLAEVGGELRGRLLDVGCGERPHQDLFPNVERYIGIEHLGAVINVEASLEKSVAHVAGIIDAFAEGEHLPFRGESFDSCVAVEVLEHVPDPNPVVAEMFRVLRPGAPVVVTVPFAMELHQTPYDFRRFTVFGIRRLLEDHGFRVERILARGNFPAVAGRMMAHWLYRLGAKYTKRDGAVRMHRWAIPLVLPLCAFTLIVFDLISRMSRDETLCLGYVVLARKGGEAGDP